jgi:hypothetical protein
LPAPQVVFNLSAALDPRPVRSAQGNDATPNDDDDEDQIEAVKVRACEAPARRSVGPGTSAPTGVVIPNRASSSQRLSSFKVPFEHAQRNGVGAPLLC